MPWQKYVRTSRRAEGTRCHPSPEKRRHILCLPLAIRTEPKCTQEFLSCLLCSFIGVIVTRLVSVRHSEIFSVRCIFRRWPCCEKLNVLLRCVSLALCVGDLVSSLCLSSPSRVNHSSLMSLSRSVVDFFPREFVSVTWSSPFRLHLFRR